MPQPLHPLLVQLDVSGPTSIAGTLVASTPTSTADTLNSPYPATGHVGKLGASARIVITEIFDALALRTSLSNRLKILCS